MSGTAGKHILIPGRENDVLARVPCKVMFGPEPASLKTKFTVSVAPKASVTVSGNHIGGRRLLPG